jgi:hypothetical protein
MQLQPLQVAFTSTEAATSEGTGCNFSYPQCNLNLLMLHLYWLNLQLVLAAVAIKAE